MPNTSPAATRCWRCAAKSLSLWRGFRDDLQADAGTSIDYQEKGTLVVAVGRDEVDRLRARHALHLRAGLGTRWMGASAVLDLEPGLRPNVAGGIFCPDDHQVDPRLTVDALRAAFLAGGGRLVEGAPVEALDLSGGCVSGVVVDGQLCRAGHRGDRQRSGRRRGRASARWAFTCRCAR